MIIRSLKLRGMGAFSAEIDVPIAELGDAQVVAVVGPNGAGKTTLLELVPGALYRTSPSRGAVAGLATERESFVELGLDVGDDSLVARLLINGTGKGKPTEAYLALLDAAWTRVPLTDGKARSYDAEVSKRLPSLATYLAGAFAVQGGSGRFLSLAPAARKALFAQLLGLGRLELMAAAAVARARAGELELATVRARRDGLAVTAERLPALEIEAQKAEAAKEAADLAVDAAVAETAKARAAVESWTAESTRLGLVYAAAESVARESRAKLAAATAVADDLRLRVAALDATAAQLASKAHLGAVTFELGTEEELTAQLSRAEEELETDRRERADARAALVGWTARRSVAAAELRSAEHDAKTAWERARRDATAATEALRQAEESATSLGTVPCGGAGDYAGCRLIATAVQRSRDVERLRAEAASLAETARHTPPAEAARVAEATKALADLDQQRPVESFPPLVDHAAEVARIKANLEHDRKERARAAEAKVAADRLAEVQAEREQLSERRTYAEDAQLDADVLAGNADDNESCAKAAIEAHVKTRPATATDAVERAARVALAEAVATAARAAQRLADAQAAAVGLVAAEAELASAVAELDDWTELGRALGRNGVQALEIDAAGPEVSDLANELLTACYGSRFALSLETAALKADGGTKEIFDLRVIDTERGTDGTADQLSGGEQVLVNEALSLAICIYNTRRCGVPMGDLFRDECAGALSSDNASRYVEMLRRAVGLGGFHRVYFVAHQPHLWDLADARLVVKDGTVTVDGAVRAEEVK